MGDARSQAANPVEEGFVPFDSRRAPDAVDDVPEVGAGDAETLGHLPHAVPPDADTLGRCLAFLSLFPYHVGKRKIKNLDCQYKILDFFSMSNLVQDARMKLGITQQELGELLGITKNYVWMLESGQKPVSKKVAARLAEITQGNVSQNLDTVGGSVPMPMLTRAVLALERIAATLEKLLPEQGAKT